MNGFRRFVAVTVMVILSGIIASADENVGGLFDIGISGRGEGLGGGYSALVDDESAAFYNPAALGWYEGFGLSSIFARGFGGIAYGSVGFAVPYLGIDLLFLDSGPISVGEGTFSYASQGIVASIGVPLGSVGFGVRWRYLHISSPFTGSGWSIDPALLVVTDAVRVAILYEGVVSSPIEYDTGGSDQWDSSLRIGLALTLSPAPDVLWNAAFEASGLFSSASSLSGGIEAWIGGLGARVGYDGEGPTFGLSIRFNALQIDWAYATRGDLGDSHRVSLSLRF
ncbi:hypothetical protein DRJ24_06035 [Candidatus Acetothermia bacterium]|nr:MAG: hypothetical protein DRJ24_06035 [Candidatus Acetothermia bacterium]